MRYIKKFNESTFVSTETTLKELMEFCDEKLIFLLDENFILKYHFINVEYDYEIHKVFLHKSGFEKFSWDDINDNYLQFLELLKEKYRTRNLDIRFIEPDTTETKDYVYNPHLVTKENLNYDNLDKLDDHVHNVGMDMTFIQIEVLLQYLF